MDVYMKSPNEPGWTPKAVRKKAVGPLIFGLVFLTIVMSGIHPQLAAGALDSYRKPVAFAVPNPSFEDGLQAWQQEKTLNASVEIDENESYYGVRSVRVKTEPGGQCLLAHEISLAKKIDVTDGLSAGVWVRVGAGQPVGSGEIRLSLFARGAKDAVLLAEDALPAGSPQNTWLYLKAKPVHLRTGLSKISRFRITLSVKYEGIINFDYIQAGESGAFNGNPQKLIMASYIILHGNENDWHVWQYAGSYPDEILDNGRRNIASVYYPAIGVYDAKDSKVIDYHINLARAAGIDAFQIDYYGDLHQDYVKTTELMFEAAERSDFKLSFLYEPKIHLNGWIRHGAREEADDAIVNDIANIIDRYGKSKAFLRYNGQPIISLFGISEYGLKNNEWNRIVEKLHLAGYNPLLIGDRVDMNSIISTDPTPFTGMFNWVLYQHQLDHADKDMALLYCQEMNKLSVSWAIKKPMDRFAVGLVFPGFNDLKVRGWGVGTRIIDITGKDFYEMSWRAVLENKYDFGWILIATFNDWAEGTIIEPDKDTGCLRLALTQRYIAQFKGIPASGEQSLADVVKQYLDDPGTTKYK